MFSARAEARRAIARMRAGDDLVRYAVWVYRHDDEELAFLLVREWQHGRYAGMALEGPFYSVHDEPTPGLAAAVESCEGSPQTLARLAASGRLRRVATLPESAVPSWCRAALGRVSSVGTAA